MKRKAAALLAAAAAFSMLSAPAMAADGQTAELMSAQDARPSVVQIAGQLTAGHPEAQKEEEKTPDPQGTLSFGNLKDRMLENNKNILMLEEKIAAIESIDYNKLAEDLRDKLNYTANLQ